MNQQSLRRFALSMCALITTVVVILMISTNSHGNDHFEIETIGYSHSYKCPMLLRRRLIQSKCRQNHWIEEISNKRKYWPLLVDDKHKTLYCAIPKAACSSFKTLILKSVAAINPSLREVHKKSYLRSYGMRYLDEYDEKDIEIRLATYYKFLVVRHPFDRLVSAYLNKIAKKGRILRPYLPLIKKHLKDNETVGSQGIPALTFEQFLHFIVQFPANFTNTHWQSYYNLCHPCNIQYDDVIKLETIDEDMNIFVKRYLNSTNRNSSVLQQRNAERSLTENKLQVTTTFFSNISRSLMRELLQIYEKDFSLFGYTWDQKTGARCQQLDDKGLSCC